MKKKALFEGSLLIEGMVMTMPKMKTKMKTKKTKIKRSLGSRFVIGLSLGLVLCVASVWGCASGSEDGSVCGNGRCEAGESRANCPTDCPVQAVCGNSLCEEGETYASCPDDCAPAECGNGVCEVGETEASCPGDCGGGSVCGDGVCDADEDETTCPGDCGGGSVCGDGVCDADEDETTCPGDCGGGSVCGDGVCDVDEDETTCPGDCGGGSVCGDGVCDADEDETTCPGDCGGGSVCGDGVCDVDEDETSCPSDCGSSCTHSPCDILPQCGCSTGKCTVVGGQRACADAGSSSEGQACSVESDCVTGATCSGFSATDPMCYRFCQSDTDCSGGPGSLCIYELDDGQGGSVPDIKLCSMDCEPATNSGCPTSLACEIYIRDTDDALLTDCGRPVGTSMFGCDGQTTFCPAGYTCDTMYNECLQWCRVGHSDCNAGYTCYPFTDPAYIGNTEYGLCDY